jgi:hypothetical protein
MPPIFEVPTTLQLKRIEAIRLPSLNASSRIFDYFPDEFSDATVLRWAQKDSFSGMQQVRGLGGKPAQVSMVGDNIFLMDPGVYGDFVALDEAILTERRDAALLSGGPVSLGDLVGEAQAILLARRWTLKAYILWQLVLNGQFVATNKQGVVVVKASYTQQTYAAAVPWSTTATATPIKDLQALSQVTFGQGVDSGSSAVVFVNQVTAYGLLNNTNPNDLGGKRIGGGNTPLSLEDFNKIGVSYGVPTVEINDEFWVNETTGVVTRFIPTGQGVLICKRKSGTPIGAYRHTNNLQSDPGEKGIYRKVIMHWEDQVPRSVEVHDGHNGGPVLYFPGTIVKVSNL